MLALQSMRMHRGGSSDRWFDSERKPKAPRKIEERPRGMGRLHRIALQFSMLFFFIIDERGRHEAWNPECRIACRQARQNRKRGGNCFRNWFSGFKMNSFLLRLCDAVPGTPMQLLSARPTLSPKITAVLLCLFAEVVDVAAAWMHQTLSAHPRHPRSGPASKAPVSAGVGRHRSVKRRLCA